jgi:hypothetical protein
VYSYSPFHRNKQTTNSANKEGPKVQLRGRTRAAIQKLKKAINLNKMLAYLNMDPEHEFQINMNASDMGLSPVLTHIQERKERPISFVSRQLNTVGKKLSVI